MINKSLASSQAIINARLQQLEEAQAKFAAQMEQKHTSLVTAFQAQFSKFDETIARLTNMTTSNKDQVRNEALHAETKIQMNILQQAMETLLQRIPDNQSNTEKTSPPRKISRNTEQDYDSPMYAGGVAEE